MLKQRLITAFTLGPLLLWAFVVFPDPYFAGLVALIMILGAKEWVVIARLPASMLLPYLVVFSLLIYGCWWLAENSESYTNLILYVSCAWWLAGFIILYIYNTGHKGILSNRILRSTLGLVVLLPTFTSMYVLRNSYGVGMLFYLLFLIWFADSGAYFFGKRFGKNKLIPNVSPGKTWEGVVGGIAASILFSLVFAYFNEMITSDNYLLFIVAGIITIIFSIEGDLMESMFKRQVNIKDSSNILPGHGGILDRIDSLTSATPIFVTCLLLFGFE